MTSHLRRTVRITNELGLHLRAAGALVQVASQFSADVRLRRQDVEADAKSIMSVLSLAASKGAEVEVDARGEDARRAVEAVAALIERGFEDA